LAAFAATTTAVTSSTASAATVAATSAATSAATIATAATRTTAGAATLLFASFVHNQRSAFERRGVEGANGILGMLIRRHCHETETARAAGFAIVDDARLDDFAVNGKHVVELGIGGAPGKIADVDLCAH
jgi:hypothetical protein